MSIVVVTGASSGIGEAIAISLAAEGHTICAIARSEHKLKKLAERNLKKINIFPLDVSDAQKVKQVFSSIEDKYGAVDVLINNAGVPGHKGNLYEYDFEGISNTIDINLKGTMYCTYAAIPSMIARKRGRIINISSMAGLKLGRSLPVKKGTVGFGDYHASKHGVVGFSAFMAKDLAPFGVLVTTLCPGGVRTQIHEGSYPGDIEKLMKPVNVADLVSFLLKQPKEMLFRTIAFSPMCEL